MRRLLDKEVITFELGVEGSGIEISKNNIHLLLTAIYVVRYKPATYFLEEMDHFNNEIHISLKAPFGIFQIIDFVGSYKEKLYVRVNCTQFPLL